MEFRLDTRSRPTPTRLGRKYPPRMAKQSAAVEPAVKTFISDCQQVLTVAGTHAETSLYSQFEKMLQAVLFDKGVQPMTILQQVNADSLGVPDYRVQDGNELKGWVELKAVLGKDLGQLKGHDERQAERYQAGLDNVIYTTGWQWRLYQHGKQIGREVVLGPPDLFDHTRLPHPVSAAAISELETLLRNFSAAASQSYSSADAAVSALAARARGLKLALIETGRANAGQHLGQLEADFKALLFKNGLPFTWERFVDSYVQLAVFGALLWRLETGATVSMSHQVGVSAGLHPLLNQCLSILWAPQSRIPILEPLLEELCLTINNISPALFTPKAGGSKFTYLPDPIVHAYEPFFKVYDPAARETSGVYYTPVEIVSQIVDGVRHLLASSLGKPDNLLNPDAQFLDPATGTGTFLLGLANAVASEATLQGLPPDSMVEQILTKQTSAFELFPGPYTIAHQRLEVALKSFGVQPTQRLPIYLADTLEAPATGQLPASGFGLAGVEIQKERAQADLLKTAEKILVILGNPPYERVLEAQGGNLEPFAQALLSEIASRTPATHKQDLKSTKDLFVAFWAWALWAMQSPKTRTATAGLPTITPTDCHGMIAFITNRTWIVGRSLVGLRALVREGAKEIWILDLGGDSRGAHGAHSFAGGDANVFGIRTGVAIAWVVFDRNQTAPPTLRYARVLGSKGIKLGDLAQPFDPSMFKVVSGPDNFLPDGWYGSPVANAPALSELFASEPQTGLQTARDKSIYAPIGTSAAEVLDVAGGQLVGRLGDWSRLSATAREKAWATAQSKRAAVATPDPKTLDSKLLREYAYRPLDYRWLYDDPKWIDWDRPTLHEIYAAGNTPSLITLPGDHGNGPAAFHVERLMDQHCFRGSDGGKAIFSLWHPHEPLMPLPDARTVVTGGVRCGFSTVVYDWLDKIGRTGSVEDAYDVVLAVLSAPSYTAQFWQALESDELRVPLTLDGTVFDRGAVLGKQLREIWTLQVKEPGVAWQGAASQPALGSATHISGFVQFANGRSLAGVPATAWDFQVSNYPVLKSWFMARRHWTATPSQSKQAIQVVSAVVQHRRAEPSLDQLLADVTATA